MHNGVTLLSIRMVQMILANGTDDFGEFKQIGCGKDIYSKRVL